MKEWEAALVRYLGSSNPEIGKSIADEGTISDEVQEKLEAALNTFKSTWN
jgi:hypothetical protein